MPVGPVFASLCQALPYAICMGKGSEGTREQVTRRAGMSLPGISLLKLPKMRAESASFRSSARSSAHSFNLRVPRACPCRPPRVVPCPIPSPHQAWRTWGGPSGHRQGDLRNKRAPPACALPPPGAPPERCHRVSGPICHCCCIGSLLLVAGCWLPVAGRGPSSFAAMARGECECLLPLGLALRFGSGLIPAAP